MPAPALTIDVEPLVGGSAVHLPLAPATPGATAEFKLALRLRLVNGEQEAVTVTGIRYAFPGSSHAAADHVLPQNNFDDGPEIAAGGAKWWSNGVVRDDPLERSNVVFRSMPAPAKVRVEVRCAGFDEPATRTLPLVAHAPQGYRLPVAAADLAADERLVTSSRHWANGGSKGTQIYAYDMDVQRWDGDRWTKRKAGYADDDKRDVAYCCWEMPLRAMADGVVAEDPVDTWDDALTPDDGVPGTGNHVWITHGDERVIYPHLRKGTVPPEIVKGARVYAGQEIGRMGSSGRAGGPHVHLECRAEAGKALRPLGFGSAFVAERDTVTAPGTDGWSRMSGTGVPRQTSAIWPASTTPGFRVPAVGIARRGDWANTLWFSSSYEAFKERANELHAEKGRRLVWVGTFRDGGRLRFAGIARDGDWGNTLFQREGYAAFRDEATALHRDKGRRLTCVATYTKDGKRYFVGVARDGDWGNTLFQREGYAAFRDEATALHRDKGRRLVDVCAYVAGDVPHFVGVARAGDWGNTLFQREGYAAFRDEATALHRDKGRRLTCVATYVTGGERHFVGIARDGDWANTLFHGGDLDSFRLRADRLHAEQGRRLIGAAFYDAG